MTRMFEGSAPPPPHLHQQVRTAIGQNFMVIFFQSGIQAKPLGFFQLLPHPPIPTRERGADGKQARRRQTKHPNEVCKNNSIKFSNIRGLNEALHYHQSHSRLFFPKVLDHLSEEAY